MNLVEHFKRWFGGLGSSAPQYDAERLRAEFAARYSCFRDLLSANRKALESFSLLEQAQGQGRGLTMAQLKRHSTTAAVSVQRMINNLKALAPGGYPGLEPRFNEIRIRLEETLQSGLGQKGPLVMALDELDLADSELTGPKMASLGVLAARLGLRVPRGFVVTTAAYHLLLKHNALEDEIARLLQTADLENTDGLFAACSEIQGLFPGRRNPAASGPGGGSWA